MNAPAATNGQRDENRHRATPTIQRIAPAKPTAATIERRVGRARAERSSVQLVERVRADPDAEEEGARAAATRRSA